MNRREILKQLSVIPLVGTTMTPELFASQASPIAEETKENIYHSIGVDTIINKKLITASRIFRFTMAEEVSSIKCLTGTEAEVMEFVVKPDAPATKVTLAEIDFPREAIIGGVIRGKNAFIAHGETHIKPYDRVVVFALPGVIYTIGKFFN